MHEFYEFMKTFDVHTLLAFAGISWYFTRSIRNEIKAETNEIKAETKEIRKEAEAQARRTDKLYEMYCGMQKEIADIYKSWDKKSQ